MAYKKVVLPVKLETGLVEEMDELIKEHKFSSNRDNPIWYTVSYLA